MDTDLLAHITGIEWMQAAFVLGVFLCGRLVGAFLRKRIK